MSSQRLARMDIQLELNSLQRIAQRNTAVVNLSTSKLYQTIDRYLVAYAGTWTGTPTSQRSASVSNTNIAPNCLEFSGNPSSGVDSKLLHCYRNPSEYSYEVRSQSINVHRKIYSGSATVARLRVLRANLVDDHSAQTEIYNETRNLELGYNDIEWLDIPISSLAGLNGYELEVTLESMSVTGSTVVHRIEAPRSYISFNSNKIDDFYPMMPTQGFELLELMRFYEKSFDLDSNPGLPFKAGAFGSRIGNALARLEVDKIFKVPKRSLGAVVAIYNGRADSDGLLNKVSTYNGASNDLVTPNLELATEFGFRGYLQKNSGDFVASPYAFNYTAESEI